MCTCHTCRFIQYCITRYAHGPWCGRIHRIFNTQFRSLRRIVARIYLCAPDLLYTYVMTAAMSRCKRDNMWTWAPILWCVAHQMGDHWLLNVSFSRSTAAWTAWRIATSEPLHWTSTTAQSQWRVGSSTPTWRHRWHLPWLRRIPWCGAKDTCRRFWWDWILIISIKRR